MINLLCKLVFGLIELIIKAILGFVWWLVKTMICGSNATRVIAIFILIIMWGGLKYA
jgi:hypothetical protein